MLTVLYICTDVDFAGSSKSLYNMIEALHGKVHPIVLLSAKGEVYDYFTKNGIQCIVGNFFYLWEKPKRLKTILHHPSKSVWYQYWKIDRECVRYVTHQLQGIKIDVVHSNTSVVTIGVDIAKALRTKHVWHIREYLDIDHGIKVFGGRKRLRWLINSADARIVITKSVNQYWKLSSLATYVINNAVRSITEIECIQQKEKYFLFLSAYLSENKGTQFAINAFAKSGLAKQGYVLKMLGRCDEGEKLKLEQLICSYNLESSVELLGFQTDVKAFYTNATAYLMTSKYEAMGRVTVDAMFYGCPVLVRATGGSVEIVTHGYNGYLFLTEGECAQFMNTIVSDKAKTQQMVQNALVVAKENFSVEDYGDKVYQVYLSVL